MTKKQRSNDQISKSEQPPNLKSKRNGRKKKAEPSFMISQASFQTLSPAEKNQAKELIKKGEWNIIRSLDDEAHDFLIYMLMQDSLKDDLLKRRIERMVAEYRKERPENYMKLIQNIGRILTETKLLGASLDAYLANYYERLKNS
ncbi:MAG TPA: hypothetical protein PK955_08235 [Methanoregulaceae archaeon]|nr:hypothetical protein [Methanoregulaceae archaeon]